MSAAAESRFAEITGAVLLGGASSRMGRDKAHLLAEGVPFATRIARRLAALCEEVLLVGGRPPPDAPGRRVPDVEGPPCALRGLVSALEAARTAELLVVAADLPLVTPDLLLALVAWPEADVVLPRSDGGREPLCALYRREPVLERARARLRDGALALHGLVDALDHSELDPAALRRVDPAGRALTNVNTPEDLARAFPPTPA